MLGSTRAPLAHRAAAIRARAPRTAAPRVAASRALVILVVALLVGSLVGVGGGQSTSSATRPPAPARAARGAQARVPAGTAAIPASRGELLTPAQCAANRAAGPVTWVSPFSYSATATILDVFVAKRLGYFADLCLDVRLITSSVTPDELVSNGAAQLSGEGSAADTIEADANGSNLVGVATDGAESDYALLTLKSITRLSELAGKTLAYHQAVPVAILEMLAAAHVKASSVHFVEDNSYNPALLDQGDFDALQAFASNEPLELRAEHLPFNEFTPSELGVKGTTGVVVVNRSYLRAHRVVVADFLRADLKALAFCLGHGRICVNIERAAARSAGVSYDTSLSLASWAVERSILERSRLPRRGLGVETTAEWRPEDRALARFGIVKHPPALSSVEDPGLVASLYHGTALIWP